MNKTIVEINKEKRRRKRKTKDIGPNTKFKNLSRSEQGQGFKISKMEEGVPLR